MSQEIDDLEAKYAEEEGKIPTLIMGLLEAEWKWFRDLLAVEYERCVGDPRRLGAVTVAYLQEKLMNREGLYINPGTKIFEGP